MFVEYHTSWLLPATDEKATAATVDMVEPLHQYARRKHSAVISTNYESGELASNNLTPLTLNVAMHDQDLLNSCGSRTYNELLKIQHRKA